MAASHLWKGYVFPGASNGLSFSCTNKCSKSIYIYTYLIPLSTPGFDSWGCVGDTWSIATEMGPFPIQQHYAWNPGKHYVVPCIPSQPTSSYHRYIRTSWNTLSPDRSRSSQSGVAWVEAQATLMHMNMWQLKVQLLTCRFSRVCFKVQGSRFQLKEQHFRTQLIRTTPSKYMLVICILDQT